MTAPHDALALAEATFFDSTNITKASALQHLNSAMLGMDFGELFFETSEHESLVLEDRSVKKASFTSDTGFGLRSVEGDRSGYAYSGDISDRALQQAAQTVRAVHRGTGKSPPLSQINKHNLTLYDSLNPVKESSLDEKIALLNTIDAYIRDQDTSVKQVVIRLGASWKLVSILDPDGRLEADISPMTRLSISVVLEVNGQREVGVAGAGGTRGYAVWLQDKTWKDLANRAIDEARCNLKSQPVLAGEMPVVLGPGWPGVMLHEAVGHGLEADFNRKKLSAFSDLLGKKVAHPAVTVIDDGIMAKQRGSIHMDDEGIPGARNTLIKDGILENYMQDRMNANLMGANPTGNGRRESYAHQPMPRMTNTFIANGKTSPKDILASLDRGIYAVNFGGGQVDITSGNFVFECTKAFWVEKGEIKYPVKSATLLGNGPKAMQHISMVGNDLALDGGTGSCGKNGQWVPVCVGQPTIRLDSVTVGGTKTN